MKLRHQMQQRQQKAKSYRTSCDCVDTGAENAFLRPGVLRRKAEDAVRDPQGDKGRQQADRRNQQVCRAVFRRGKDAGIKAHHEKDDQL